MAFSKLENADSLGKPRSRGFWTRKCALISSLIFLILAIALGVGLGVGLTRNKGGSGESSNDDSDQLPAITNPVNATNGTFWKPAAGTTWQIQLSNDTDVNTGLNVSVYDIDLFDTPNATITYLQSVGIKVICYFSAGSYENWRPDASQFQPSDYGGALSGWAGEWWLNTNSTNVRNIMKGRLDLAAAKGCDGVDPDNIDAYANSQETKLSLGPYDAVDYLRFLATEAHARNLSIGLKNGGKIVPAVLDMLQWEVNEQCHQYQECGLFQGFITSNKPVFHIEYPSNAPNIDASTESSICNDTQTTGFSTVLKQMSLDYWTWSCQGYSLS